MSNNKMILVAVAIMLLLGFILAVPFKVTVGLALLLGVIAKLAEFLMAREIL